MKTAVAICPGRGSYGKVELGYLARHFPDTALLGRFDALRVEAGQDAVSALDGASRYSTGQHTRGDNASALIYAAGLGDFRGLDGDTVEIVGVTGNSMGWYTALACARAVRAEDGFRIANTMGTLMQEAMIGGQLVYPVTGEDWQPDAARGRAALPATLFGQPELPMIDGRGAIWWPGACDPEALWDYTLGHQVTEPYDFTRAIAIAAREFAPDLFIVLGPGDTMGGAVAQSLIAATWRGMTDKAAFQALQSDSPVLISMGRDDQRASVTR